MELKFFFTKNCFIKTKNVTTQTYTYKSSSQVDSLIKQNKNKL